MENIDKIIIFLAILVFFALFSASSIVYSNQSINYPQSVRPIQSQAIIKANQPLVIRPVPNQKSKPSTKTVKGVKEQNLFRKQLTKRKEHIKYNKFVNGGEYADYLGNESNELNETEIEEKDVVNRLFGFKNQ